MVPTEIYGTTSNPDRANTNGPNSFFVQNWSCFNNAFEIFGLLVTLVWPFLNIWTENFATLFVVIPTGNNYRPKFQFWTKDCIKNILIVYQTESRTRIPDDRSSLLSNCPIIPDYFTCKTENKGEPSHVWWDSISLLILESSFLLILTPDGGNKPEINLWVDIFKLNQPISKVVKDSDFVSF